MKICYFVIFCAVLLFSSVPKILNYQGKLLDADGVGINTTANITFRLYTEESGGTPIWIEEHSGENAIVISKGLFSTELGDINSFPDTVGFSEQYWLEIVINGETLTPREKLSSAPYALRARTVELPVISYSSDLDDTRRRGNNVNYRAGSGATLEDEGGNINITYGVANLYEILISGNDAGGRQIKNLADPTLDSDAATKSYADAISAASGGVNAVSGGLGLYPPGPSYGNVTLNVGVDELTIGINGADELYVLDGGITSDQILDRTITSADIGLGAITSNNIATGAIGSEQIASTSVIPGTYNNATIIVDEDGRITSASDGAVSGIGGEGSVNYIAIFDDTHTITNASIYETTEEVVFNKDVNIPGYLKLASATLPCNTSNAGIMYWDGEHFKGCTGEMWVNLDNVPPPTVTNVTPSSGLVDGGTPITITGSNFMSPAAVSIGGVDATDVVVVSGTQITAVTPANTEGSKDVTVTNPDGLSGTLAEAYTYIVPPGSTQESALTSCLALYNEGVNDDGVYWIDPNAGSTSDAFQVYCDMTTDGGGWTLLAYAGSTSGAGNSNHILFHQIGSIATTRVYGQTSFSRFDIARQMPGTGTSSQIMWRRTNDSNVIMIHSINEMWNRIPGGSSAGNMNLNGTGSGYPISLFKLSNSGPGGIVNKSNARYENGPDYPGIAWNSSYNDNQDGVGSFTTFLNRRSLIYWETNGPESSNQWFHADPLQMGPSRGPDYGTGKKDIEIYFRP